MTYNQKNNPFKNTSFGRFTRSKQSDVAGTIGDEDITNREIGELRRTARSAQSFRERMAAKKKLRSFSKGKETEEVGALEKEIRDVSDLTTEERIGLGEKLYPETNPNDLRPQAVEGMLPSEPGDPYAYRVDENGQYHYKLGDGDWTPAAGEALKAIEERYEEEVKEIVAEKSEQAGPTIESANQTSAETISIEDAIQTDWSTKIQPVSKTKTKKKTKKGDFKFKDKFNYGGQDFNF